MAGPHRASLPTSTQTGPGGGVAVLTSTATASASFGGAAPAPALGVHSVYGGGVPAAPPSSMLIAGSTPDPRGYAQQLLQQQQQEQAPVVGRPHYLHPPQDTSAIRSTHVVPPGYSPATAAANSHLEMETHPLGRGPVSVLAPSAVGENQSDPQAALFEAARQQHLQSLQTPSYPLPITQQQPQPSLHSQQQQQQLVQQPQQPQSGLQHRFEPGQALVPAILYPPPAAEPSLSLSSLSQQVSASSSSASAPQQHQQPFGLGEAPFYHQYQRGSLVLGGVSMENRIRAGQWTMMRDTAMVPRDKGPEGANLFLCRLPEWADEIDIHAVASHFAMVRGCMVLRHDTGVSKNSARLSFSHPREAFQVMERMNGARIAMHPADSRRRIQGLLAKVDGRVITVDVKRNDISAMMAHLTAEEQVRVLRIHNPGSQQSLLPTGAPGGGVSHLSFAAQNQ